MSSRRILAAGAVVGALIVGACGGDDDQQTATTEGSPAGSPTATTTPPTDATSTDASTATTATAAPTTDESAGWSFTDDTGNTVTLDEPPEVIVGSSVVGGTLWEYGIEVEAVYGPLRGGDGEPDPQLGLADPEQFESLGEVWGEINLEKLAATKPDLIIDAMWGGEESLTSHPQWEQLQDIAPHVHIEVVDTDFATIPERFAELALALGGDATTVEEASAEFDSARERLQDAASERDDIDVSFVSASNELLYLGVIEGYTDLQFFDELGLDIVQQPPTDELTIGGVVYWTELSWEHADQVSADVIFVDTRTYSDINAILDDHPTWRALPAREAGQLGGWDVEPGYGYGNLAQLLDGMATAIEDADDVVS